MSKLHIIDDTIWIEMDNYPIEEFNTKQQKLNDVLRYHILRDFLLVKQE